MEPDRRELLKTLVTAGVLLAVDPPKIDFKAPLPQVKASAGAVPAQMEAHA